MVTVVAAEPMVVGAVVVAAAAVDKEVVVEQLRIPGCSFAAASSKAG